jgi:hypothetical protein
MKPTDLRQVPDKLMDALEEGAVDGVKALRAFLTYQGDNPTYEKKAKAGAALVGGYTRAFASQTNRYIATKMANDRTTLVAVEEPKRLAK